MQTKVILALSGNFFGSCSENFHYTIDRNDSTKSVESIGKQIGVERPTRRSRITEDKTGLTVSWIKVKFQNAGQFCGNKDKEHGYSYQYLFPQSTPILICLAMVRLPFLKEVLTKLNVPSIVS